MSCELPDDGQEVPEEHESKGSISGRSQSDSVLIEIATELSEDLKFLMRLLGVYEESKRELKFAGVGPCSREIAAGAEAGVEV